MSTDNATNPTGPPTPIIAEAVAGMEAMGKRAAVVSALLALTDMHCRVPEVAAGYIDLAYRESPGRQTLVGDRPHTHTRAVQVIADAILRVGYFAPPSPPASPSDAKLDRPIVELQLSYRAYQRLRGIGIITVRQLVNRSPAELLELNGFGEASLFNVQEKLAGWGLRLDMPTPPAKPLD